jgi:hypothetical protein
MASQRQYATIAEVEQFASITSVDDTEFEDRMSQCEELIDAYVGYQDRFMGSEFIGNVTSATGLTLVDDSFSSKLGTTDNYFAGCYVEIIGGSGVGNRRWIVSSDYTNKSITYEGASIGADTTSVFRIFQLGKFPRSKDAFLNNDDETWYKIIPEAVRRAVAAQMEFLVNQGDAYFATATMDLASESIGNYSYSRGSGSEGQSPAVKMLAPKAKALLRGYKNSMGRLHSDNPTWL